MAVVMMSSLMMSGTHLGLGVRGWELQVWRDSPAREVSEVPEVSGRKRGGESRIDTPPVGWPTAPRGHLIVDPAHDAGVPQAIEDLLGVRRVDAVLQGLHPHLLARHFAETALTQPTHDAARTALAFARHQAAEERKGMRAEVFRPQAHTALDLLGAKLAGRAGRPQLRPRQQLER